MSKKYPIIILGTGDGFELCPFDKETWAVGKVLLMIRDHRGKPFEGEFHGKISLLFNIDKVDEMLTFINPAYNKGWTLEKYRERVNKLDVPFVTSFAVEGFNNIVEFPLKEAVERYQNYYYTNSICYMIAYALMKGVTSIDFWGVNQSGMKEYVNERKGVEFWIGLALGFGLKINIHGPSSLMKIDNGRLYGYKRTYEELKDYFEINYD